MSMTVGDLREALAHLQADLPIRFSSNGDIVPVLSVASVQKASIVIIHGYSKKKPKKLSVDEHGMAGHLMQLELTEEEIAKMIGRPVEDIEKRKSRLGPISVIRRFP